MIRVKLVGDGHSSEHFWHYSEDVFLTWPLGGFHEDRTEPPFRDPESLLFIEEVDNSHLVDGDWYSYVSPFGRTCMSSFAGGTKYALTLIFNSRKGSYTSYENYDVDIWQRLQKLDMDILVAYDPNCRDWGFAAMPSELRGCIVERVCIGGTVYKEAVYDAAPRKNYMDAAGVFHFDGYLPDYIWKWGDHLEEIFKHFSWDAKKAVLPPVKPTPLLIPQRYHDFSALREVLCVSDAFVVEGNDKYPRILGLYKNRDGTLTATEGCPVKYPNLYEAIYDVIKLWRDGCESAFYTVIDTGEFFSMKSFRRPRLWYFEDDGKTLRVYSGMRGLHRLLEFADNSWQDGRMRAEK